MRKITQKEFLDLYETDLISEVFSVGNTVYGKSVKGQADKPNRHEVVYCVVV